MRCMPGILLLAYCAHLLGPGIGFWVHAAAHWVHEGHYTAHHHHAAESGAHHPHTGQADHHHSPLVLLWQHRPASNGGDAVLSSPAPLAGAWHLPAAPLSLCALRTSGRVFAPRHPVVGPGNKYADALLPVDDPPPKRPVR